MKETEQMYLLNRALCYTDLSEDFKRKLRECIWQSFNHAVQSALWNKYGGKDHIVGIIVVAYRYFNSPEVICVFDDGKKYSRVLYDMDDGLRYSEAVINMITEHKANSQTT